MSTLETLFDLKDQAGVSNEDLARMLGVTTPMISRYKNGITGKGNLATTKVNHETNARLVKSVRLLQALVRKNILPVSSHEARKNILNVSWEKAFKESLTLQ